MANAQLSDYLRQQLARGVTKEDLIKVSLGVGWKVADINDAFASLQTPAEVSGAPAPKSTPPVEVPVERSSPVVERAAPAATSPAPRISAWPTIPKTVSASVSSPQKSAAPLAVPSFTAEPEDASLGKPVRKGTIFLIGLGVLIIGGALVYAYIVTSLSIAPTTPVPVVVSEPIVTASSTLPTTVEPVATSTATTTAVVAPAPEPVKTPPVPVKPVTPAPVKPAAPASSAKGDSAIKSGLASVQTQAEIYYASTGGSSYGTQAWTSGGASVCTGGIFSDPTIAAALSGARVVCYANDQEYLVGANLSSGWWCVDSAGTSKAESGSAPLSATADKACP